ncbi:putative HVA22-like protein g [Zostera marina]|uniref:HVA22-like protein n=1 Tax=Zostera marina TaxID=29655 RepID=A0A0K9PDJ6_ZOSMR|nr:putative HVA22-like protein g [Zostera marina]
MLGEFVNKILVLVFGYVYPALECFKTIERSRNDIHGLKFWCQYWVILALLSAVEKVGDIFISWLPLYGEFKLAFMVYLWHPRTLGTYHVYETLLRPFMAQHETDIERRLGIIMNKSIDVFTFYLKNFADKGQSMVFEILHHLISLPSRARSNVRRPGGGGGGDDGGGGAGGYQQRPPPAPLSNPETQLPPYQQQYAPSAPPQMPHHRQVASAPPQYQLPENRRESSSLYPTIDNEEEDIQNGVNKVEEALRAAGVNLRKLRGPHQN